MSAGKFVVSKYEGDGGYVWSCRVQEETLDLTIDGTANAAPDGDVDIDLGGIRLRPGKRQLGVNPRTVQLEFTGDIPTGYTGDDLVVPILQKSVFDGYSVDDTGTYLGQAVKVVRKTPESYTAA